MSRERYRVTVQTSVAVMVELEAGSVGQAEDAAISTADEYLTSMAAGYGGGFTGTTSCRITNIQVEDASAAVTK